MTDDAIERAFAPARVAVEEGRIPGATLGVVTAAMTSDDHRWLRPRRSRKRTVRMAKVVRVEASRNMSVSLFREGALL